MQLVDEGYPQKDYHKNLFKIIKNSPQTDIFILYIAS